MESPVPPKAYREPVLRVLAIIAVLGLAQALLVPVVVATLITVALSPVVDVLTRWGTKKWLANLVGILLCLGAVGATGWLVGRQLSNMAGTLPEYRDRILERTRSLGPAGSLLRGAYARFQKTVEAGTRQVTEARDKVERPERSDGGDEAAGSVDDTNLFRTLRSIFLAVAGTVGNSIIVLVLVAFMLANRQDLARRAHLFFEEHGIDVTSAALSETADRVSRYLLAELTVNALYGSVVAAFAWIAGLPHPAFWGVLVFLFRFIPYVGTWIVALMAFVFSLGVAPSWVRPVSLVSFWILLEFLTADLLEPLFYGRRTGLTAVGVLLSALFWGWLWGAVGLILATPLTASLAVLGKAVPSLRWLHLFVASDPVPQGLQPIVTADQPAPH
jgi:predicted PurR-regulated permease PerM